MRGLGIDAGAGSISLAVVEDSRLIYSSYELHKGDMRHKLLRMLREMQQELNINDPGEIEYAAVNDTAAFLISGEAAGKAVRPGNERNAAAKKYDNDKIASGGRHEGRDCTAALSENRAGQKTAAAGTDRISALLFGQRLLYPEAHSILEMGAQTSAYITGIAEGRTLQYAVNGDCAAGTGAFFEDQMYRLGLPLEAYSEYTDRAKSVPRLAGRCSVFAKTDLIHRQQEGVPAEDILLGLAYAVVRNFKTTVMRSLPVEKPVLLTGGIVNNRGAVRAIRDILELEGDELICGERGAIVSAAGLAKAAIKNRTRLDFTGLISFSGETKTDKATTGAAAEAGSAENYDMVKQAAGLSGRAEGVCGCTGTNTGAKAKAAASAGNTVNTGTNANTSVCACEACCEPEEALQLKNGTGTPRNEGQLPTYGYDKDSLHRKREPRRGERIWLGVDIGSTSTNLVLTGEDDAVLDYCYIRTAGNPGRAVDRGLELLKDSMDKSGRKPEGIAVTGSGRYLIAKKLGTDKVIDEITAQAKAAARLYPEADTVFEIGGQDSKYISLRNGQTADFEMNKVCAAGTGSFIEEQAGRLGIELADIGPMALAAKAPAELGERCTVLMETRISAELADGTSKPDICAGLCRSIVRNYLNRVVANKHIGKCICLQGGIINNEGIVAAFYEQFGERLHITPYYDVTGAYGAAIWARTAEGINGGDEARNREIYHRNRAWFYAGYDGRLIPGRRTVGIPLSLMMYKFFPMAYKYFTELGYNVLMSGESNEEIIRISQDVTQEETCYPVKLLHGHMEYLARRGVDYIFIPCIRTIRHETSGVEHNYGCVYMQTAPTAVGRALRLAERGIKLLSPVLDMDMGQPQLAMSMIQTGLKLGHAREECQAAMKLGAAAMQACDRKSEELGQQIMDSLKPEDKVLVMITRNYGLNDPVLNMGIPGELLKRGCKVLNLSHLHGHSMNLSDEYPNLYWPFSQHILTGAKIIKEHPNLYAVYLTNHGCGPDTMISHLFKEIMGDKPYLSIEVDEHQSAVGVVTRIEAFLNSLKATDNNTAAQSAEKQPMLDKTANMASLDKLAGKTVSDLQSAETDINSDKQTAAETAADAGEKVPMSSELQAEAGAQLILQPLGSYSTLYAALLRSKGVKTAEHGDYTAEDLVFGRQESISKEYSSFSAAAGRVLREAHEYAEEDESDSRKPGITFMLPQTEGAEAEGMTAMVVRALLREHGFTGESFSLYTPYIEKLLSDVDSTELWRVLMLGDALMCMSPQQREAAAVKIEFPLSAGKTAQLLQSWHDELRHLQEDALLQKDEAACRTKVFLFGTPEIMYSDYLNRNMFEAVRVHGFIPVPMMLSEYLWFWVRESGKNVPEAVEQELNAMRLLYADIWGDKPALSEAYERLNAGYAPVVGANIRYLCSLIAESVPGAAGSMLLMPSYSNAGAVIELMKPESPVPFMHFEAEGSSTKDEIERREIWLNLLKT